TGYDQLSVHGTNKLAGAALTVIPALTTPVALGQKFTILNNDGVEAIIGTFNGLPEGATVSSGGYKFAISYVGGTGNDVVLTLIEVPGSVVSSSVAAGNGNHAIDPNECNNLSLIISNKTGLAMANVTATLTTTNPAVFISSPYATY